jgi:hypothetical protein
MTVPSRPAPLPRRTTPLAPMVSVLADRYRPARRRTAPRTPLTRGRADTVLMAAWIAAVSSAPEGPIVSATGTMGMGTPPPR